MFELHDQSVQDIIKFNEQTTLSREEQVWMAAYTSSMLRPNHNGSHINSVANADECLEAFNNRFNNKNY